MRKDSWKPSAPPYLSRAPPNSLRKICRSCRTGACSEVRTWSNWTELGGLVLGDERAAVELGRARAARVQVDEQVALEEEARAQLHRRVLADRQGAVLEVHRDDGGVLALAVRVGQVLDVGDLADVDAGDPDRALGADVLRVGEDRLELVAVAARTGSTS